MRICWAAYCGLCVLFISAPVPAQQKADVQVSQLQGTGNNFADTACSLILNFPPPQSGNGKIYAWVMEPGGDGARLENYSLYVVTDSSVLKPAVCDETREYINAGKASAGCSRPEPEDPNRPVCPSVSGRALTQDQFATTITVPLVKPLHSDLHYVLTIQSSKNKTIEVPFNNATSILFADVGRESRQVKVTSTMTLNATVHQAITVVNQKTGAPSQTAKGSVAKPDTYSATVERIDADGVVLNLERKLPAASTPLQLEIDGFTDWYNTKVPVKGKLSPTVCSTGSSSVSCAFMTVQLSATAAVHSVPTFSTTGAIAPWHPAARALWLPNLIQFDPVVNFDIGSLNAKTSNSVIVPSQFSRSFVFGLPQKPKGDATAGKSNSTQNEELLPLGTKARLIVGANATFGYRAEFDMQYGGVNQLGEGRGELYFPQLYRSADVQKAVVAAGNPAIRDQLQLPNLGYSIAPYVQYDGGGHVNSQTIANPKGSPTLMISTYDISRLYTGLYGSATVGRTSWTFDGSWVHFFVSETVPYTVNKVVYSKAISGFQPHAKGTFDFAIDATRHFLLSLSWEDGRSAPSFAYVNKATAGLKVVY
jgi:hypothetical protein